jgi:hypothetical protein
MMAPSNSVPLPVLIVRGEKAFQIMFKKEEIAKLSQELIQ